MKRGILTVTMLLAFGWQLAVAATVAAESAADESVQDSGRQALSDSAGYPWYDSEADDVRRIQVREDEVDSASSSATNGQSYNTAFSGGDWFTPLAWIGIATLVGLLVFVLVRAFLARERHAAGAAVEEDEADIRDMIDRVEELPIKIRRPASDLLSEARAQYEAGNYAEAIIYLYSHQLVSLDRQQLIRLTKGKTNRQYLREMVAPKALQGLVEQTMIVFEDVFFGKYPLSRSRFEAIWNRLAEFDMLLQQEVPKCLST